jgi:hypothetical protein
VSEFLVMALPIGAVATSQEHHGMYPTSRLLMLLIWSVQCWKRSIKHCLDSKLFLDVIPFIYNEATGAVDSFQALQGNIALVGIALHFAADSTLCLAAVRTSPLEMHVTAIAHCMAPIHDPCFACTVQVG